MKPTEKLVAQEVARLITRSDNEAIEDNRLRFRFVMRCLRDQYDSGEMISLSKVKKEH